MLLTGTPLQVGCSIMIVQLYLRLALNSYILLCFLANNLIYQCRTLKNLSCYALRVSMLYSCKLIALLHFQNNLDELFMLMHFLDAGKVSVISGL